jgi:hypothetical protein
MLARELPVSGVAMFSLIQAYFLLSLTHELLSARVPMSSKYGANSSAKATEGNSAKKRSKSNLFMIDPLFAVIDASVILVCNQLKAL